jgi:hypothetical protein
VPKTIISENTYLVAQQELKKLRNEGALFKKLQALKLAMPSPSAPAGKILPIISLKLSLKKLLKHTKNQYCNSPIIKASRTTSINLNEFL